jgi:hypothetical protein
LRNYRWDSWEEVLPSEDWQDLGELVIDQEWNGAITHSLGDDGSWAKNLDRSLVSPGVLAQKTLQKVTEHLYCPSRPGQTSLHARHFTRVENPVTVGEVLTVVGRIPEKFIKRDRQYIIYEAWLNGTDGVPRMYWRQTRMVAKVGD